MAMQIYQLQAAAEAIEIFDEDELEEYAFIQCPACDSVNNRVESALGQLGSIIHHRCRYCGAGFSEEKS